MTALLPEFPAISAKNFNLVDWLSYFTPASTRSLSHYIEIHRDTLCDSNSSQPPISDKKNSIKSRDSRVNYLSMRATWLTSNEHLYRQCRYIFLRRLSFFKWYTLKEDNKIPISPQNCRNPERSSFIFFSFETIFII